MTIPCRAATCSGREQGKGRVQAGNATKVVLGSKKGVGLSQALFPSYAEIDSYRWPGLVSNGDTGACGARHFSRAIAILDNFCWCSSDEPERLAAQETARGVL